MDGAEHQRPLSRAELREAIRDLQVRVAALEHEPAPRRSRSRPGLDLGLIEALRERADTLADPKTPAGTVTYAGVTQLGEESLAWQMFHSVPDLLALDEATLARQLAAIASPVRLRILRELGAGALRTQELEARLDEPSAGQLYHHLRELLATGLVAQTRRGVYELPSRVAIPLLTLIACTHDLTSGAAEETEAR